MVLFCFKKSYLFLNLLIFLCIIINLSKYMKKIAILDFDNTLVDTISVHAESWKHAIEVVLNIEVPIESVLADIDYGIGVFLKKYQLTDDEIKMARGYKREYFLKNLHKTKLNNFVLYAIENSLFEKCYIASNSSRENIDKMISYHGINKNLFSMIITRDECSTLKPNPQMGEKIIENSGYSKDSFIVIGDSEVDLTFARKLGIECLLIKSL